MLVVVCSFCEHPLSVMCFVKYHKNLVTGAINRDGHQNLNLL